MKNILKKIDAKYWVCRNWIRDNIWYYLRYGKFGDRHHIVDTGLPPAPWRSVSTKMLYSVMSIVEWFVENDMQMHSANEFEAECERIMAEDPPSYRAGNLKLWIYQRKKYLEICEIYVWWKNYDRRDEDFSHALSAWASYCEGFSSRDDVCFLTGRNNMNEDERVVEVELKDKIEVLREALDREEDEMLKRAIDLRECMW